jgi:hypothetical protein
MFIERASDNVPDVAASVVSGMGSESQNMQRTTMDVRAPKGGVV